MQPEKYQSVNIRRPISWWERMSLTLTVKDAQSVVEMWTRDSPPPDGKVWVWRWRWAKKGLTKVQFFWGGDDRHMEYHQKEDGFGGQGLIFRRIGVWNLSSILFPLSFESSQCHDDIYTLIYFGCLQNINVCLRPGKMNGYGKAPVNISLLKMSKIVVKPIWSEPTLL